MRFNKFLLNPAFSFAREQNSYITLFNKREWYSLTMLPNVFSKLFVALEKIKVYHYVFNKIMGTYDFGGVANFAQNVYLDQDSNLTLVLI
jgi:hypothetical protein